MKAYIKAVSYYLPEMILTNEQLVEEFPEWTVEKVASKIGISQRHIAASDETATDMAVRASEILFEEYEMDRSIVDFVLFCTQSPDHNLPTSACLIQQRLGLSIKCGALDYNLGCSGYVYGLSLAKGLILSGIAKNVLLLTGETYSKYLHPRDKGNRTIFGDAATASLISKDGFASIEGFSLGTDGQGAQNLIIQNGGARNPHKENFVTFDENQNPLSNDHLYMNGSEIFNFTLEKVPVLINETLFQNNLTQEQIDLFIFHQANKYMMNFLRKKLKIEEDKFFYFLETVGNTVSCTIPIALKEALKDSDLKAGQHILLAGFGVGYSWGGCVLKYN